MDDQKNKNPEVNEELATEETKVPASPEPQMSEAEVREKVARSLAKGTIKLETPILSRDQEVAEVHYDFNHVTGMDYIEAMDSDPRAANAFKISNKQAFELFLKGASKCNRDTGLDERDLRTRMGMSDVMAAVRISLVFFITKSRGADARTKNE